MKKIPNKCHQGALLNHTNFWVIFGGIALKIELHHPCHQLFKGQQEKVPLPKS